MTCPEGWIELLRLLRGDRPRIDTNPTHHGKVHFQVCRVLRWGKDEQAKRLKTAIPTHHFLPVLKILQTLKGQAYLRFICVMHPDQRTTLASCAGSKILALDYHHALHTGPGQVKGGTGAIRASPNHDNICCFHSLLLA